MNPIRSAAVTAVVALALVACEETPQVVVYEQGEYQGKPDTPPWDSEQFKGDKEAWNSAIKTRQQAQNEYRKMP